MRGYSGRALLLCVGLALSCAEEARVQFVELPSVDARYGLFIIRNEAGVVVRPPEAEIRPIGETIGDLPRNFEWQGGEVELLFVGLAQEQLDTYVPLLDETRIENPPAVRVERWTCGETDFQYDKRTLHIQVPRDATLLRYGRDDPGFSSVDYDQVDGLEDVALGFPIDFGRCGEGAPTELGSFGPSVQLIPEDATVAGISLLVAPSLRDLKAVVRVDDDRLIAVGPSVVFLFERGRAYVDEPDHVVPLLELSSAGWSVDIDPRLDQDPRPVFVGGARPARIFELALGSTGIELVGTSSPTEGGIEELLVDELGRVVAAQYEGFLFTKEPGQSELVSYQISRRLEGLGLSRDPARPHLIASADGLFVGNAFTMKFDQYQLNALGISTLALNDVASRTTETSTEIWVGGQGGLVGVVDRDALEIISLTWSPDWSECTATPRECGENSLSDDIGEIGIDTEPGSDEWIYMRATSCDSAIMAVHNQKRCVAKIRPPDAAANDQINSIDVRGGWLTAVGNGGRVYEMRLTQ